jgi:predicted ester cyclase
MPTTPERNKNIVLRFFLAANNNAMQELDSIMDENFVTHGPQTLLAYARGRDAHKQGIMGFKQTFPDATINPLIMFAEGNKVMAHVRVTARHTHEFMGKQPTFDEVVWTATSLTRLNDDGVMVERWVIEDFMGMFMQLGIIKMPS